MVYFILEYAKSRSQYTARGHIIFAEQLRGDPAKTLDKLLCQNSGLETTVVIYQGAYRKISY